jgi:hypothetical protein
LTEDRTYRSGLTLKEAGRTLDKIAGDHLDPGIVALARCHPDEVFAAAAACQATAIQEYDALFTGHIAAKPGLIPLLDNDRHDSRRFV